MIFLIFFAKQTKMSCCFCMHFYDTMASLHFYVTRLLGRFAPIFYFNCEHVLIVNIEKQRRKKFRGFYENFLRIFKI